LVMIYLSNVLTLWKQRNGALVNQEISEVQ
jgi:hypothetical protein